MHKRFTQLKRVGVLKKMNEKHLDLLKPLFESYSCLSGTKVIQQGKPADYIYLVISGRAQVSFKPDDGPSMTISHVSKDGLFGWSAVVGSRTYTSSVTAIENLETYRIRGSDLRKLCVEHPEAGKDILERLADGVSSRWTNARTQVKAILAQGLKN
jgi:CRP-like cAMP-binding protein